MTRSGCGVRAWGWLVALLLGSAVTFAAPYQENDPLPPGAHGDAYPLEGNVLTLKPEILEIRGIAAAMTGQVQSLEGALKDLGATVKGKEIKISLAADVLFDFDKADLRPEAAPELERVLTVLRSYARATVLIEGHTDGKGGDQYNQKLSEQRAESVRRWLADHGAQANMTIRGWGKTRPIAPNTKPNGGDDPEGRQKNRRVEITVKT